MRPFEDGLDLYQTGLMMTGSFVIGVTLTFSKTKTTEMKNQQGMFDTRKIRAPTV